MPSPPKPWERNGATPATVTAVPTSTTTSTAAAPNSTSSTITTPALPTRPAALSNASAASTLNATSPLATTSNTAYSPYNRLSPYGTSMYSNGLGGYGNYGGMGMGSYGLGGYGSYGGGYGGYGGIGGMGGMGYGGMGMGGMYGQPMNPFDPNNPQMNPTLTQTLESTTQQTFALLHSVVQTFAGLAQMLESTFMATHSSFFALAGVVDQFAMLRNALGSVLGLFGLVRWMKDLLLGTRSQDAGALRGEFRDFLGGRPVPGAQPGQPQPPRASRKPLIIFFLAIFGVPYAMHRLVKIITERQRQPLQQNPQNPLQSGSNPAGAAGLPPLDPSQLQFARALYPFTAMTPAELSLKKDEIVAIMGKLDPERGIEVDPRIQLEGGDGEWWRGRTREGREGWFPRAWVEVLERKGSNVGTGVAVDGTTTDAKKVD